MFLGQKLIFRKKEDLGADIFQLEKQKGHLRVIIFKVKKLQMSRSRPAFKTNLFVEGLSSCPFPEPIDVWSPVLAFLRYNNFAFFCHYFTKLSSPPRPPKGQVIVCSYDILIKTTYMSQTQMKANMKQHKSTSYNSGLCNTF